MSPIAKRIRAARLRLGLTKAQLAEKSGVSTSYLTQLESNEGATIKSPGAKKLAALAKALGVTMESLMSDAEGKRAS